MKSLLAVNAGLFVLSATLFIAVFAPSQILSAQGILDAMTSESAESDDPENTTDDQRDDSEGSVVYEYIAQSGDSYTLLSRKATQTFGLKHDVSLSGAQIIFVETNLTQEAGAPLLDEGEEISIDESDVATWVERAQELSEEEEAAWSNYVQFVDFNTDAVGESVQ